MFFDTIKSIFEDKLTEDVREPLYMFGDNYGFYLPSLSFWIQLSLVSENSVDCFLSEHVVNCADCFLSLLLMDLCMISFFQYKV